MCRVIADAVIEGRGGDVPAAAANVPAVVAGRRRSPASSSAAPAVETVVVADECAETESPAAAIATSPRPPRRPQPSSIRATRTTRRHDTTSFVRGGIVHG